MENTASYSAQRDGTCGTFWPCDVNSHFYRTVDKLATISPSLSPPLTGADNRASAEP